MKSTSCCHSCFKGRLFTLVVVGAPPHSFSQVAKEPGCAVCVHSAANFVHIADHVIGLAAPSLTTFLSSVETCGDRVVGELGCRKNCPVQTRPGAYHPRLGTVGVFLARPRTLGTRTCRGARLLATVVFWIPESPRLCLAVVLPTYKVTKYKSNADQILGFNPGRTGKIDCTKI